MANDILGRAAPEFGGAFTADSATATFGGVTADTGLVTQSLRFQYQQNVTRMFDVGSRAQYFIAGRPQGTADMNRALGPVSLVTAFYSVYGNVCNAATNVLTFVAGQSCKVGSGSASKVTMILSYVVLTGLSFNVEAERMQLQEQAQLMYVSLTASSVAVT